MQANVLPVDGLNTSAPASSFWQLSERPNLPEQLASIIHGPLWWLPLPILQDTALIAVNQPLSNSCLVIQNQRGTKPRKNKAFYVIVGLSARIVYRQAPLVNIEIKH